MRWYLRRIYLRLTLAIFTFVCTGQVYLNSALALSMQEAVRLAVENHPSGHVQRANERALAHELDASRKQFLPQVRVFGDIGKQKVDNVNALSSTDNGRWKLTREIGVSASLLLFDGFERANTIYQNAARLDGAIYTLLATSETLALNAVEAYIDVVRHLNLVSLAKKNVARHREILRQIRQRVEGGKAPSSDGIQIQERVFAAETVQVEIQKAYQDSLSKFRKIVGTEPGRNLSIPTIKTLPASVSALVDISIANNYELKAAEKNIRESEFSREANAGALAPRLSLEGSTSYGEDRGGSYGDETDIYVGLKLSWKVFDGGITNSRNLALGERIGQAQYQRDIAVRNIREVAEKSWNGYTSGRQRRVLLASQVKSNKRIVTSYVQEYEISKRSLLDVLDAERALFNAQFQQIGVRAAYRFSAFRMLATMSRLAEYFGIAASDIAQEPYVEERVISDPAGIFNIKIEPLR